MSCNSVGRAFQPGRREGRRVARYGTTSIPTIGARNDRAQHPPADRPARPAPPARLRRQPRLLPGRAVAGSRRSRRERRLVFNYAKSLVEKTTSYLMSGIGFAVDPDGDSPESQERARRAEKALLDVYEANQLAQLDFDTELDAAVLGDGAFKVTWDTRGAPRPRLGAGRAGHLRLVAGRRRLPHLARRQPLHPPARGGRDALRRRCRQGTRPRQGLGGRRGVDGARVRAVAGRRPHRAEGQPLRLHPLRHLPQPARAQALLGRLRRARHPRVGAAS